MSADGVQLYLTGAASQGGIQSNPAASLGGYRSSTRVASMTPNRVYPIPNVRIDFVSGGNVPGVGQLKAVSSNALSWSAPGDASGTSVTIANGETKTLVSDDADAYIVVTRTSTAALIGIEAVQIMDTMNNWLGMSIFDEAESTAGEEKYRAGMLLNGSGAQATSVKVWLDSSIAGLMQIAKEAPSSNAIQTVADETTQPSGLSWVSPTTEGTALDIGTLNDGDEYGLWVEQYVGTGATADPYVDLILHYTFTISGTQHYNQWRGLNRIAEAGLELYKMYLETAIPDPSVDSPVATSATRPVTYNANLTEGIYYPALYYTNRFGLLSAPDAETPEPIYIDADGEVYTRPPRGPALVTVTPGASGVMQVDVIYQADREGVTQTAIDTYAATDVALYITTDGTTPTTGLTPVVATLGGGRMRRMLRYTTAAYADGTPFKVLVAMRRIAEDLSYIDSEDTLLATGTAAWVGPTRPPAVAFQGRTHGLDIGRAAPPDGSEIAIGATGWYWVLDENNAYLYSDNGPTLFWRFIRDPDNAANDTLYINSDYSVSSTTITGAGTAEVIEDAGSNIFYFNVNSVRALKVDVSGLTIEVENMDSDSSGFPAIYPEVPALLRYSETVYLSWNAATERYEIYAMLDADTLHLGCNLNTTLDQTAILAL